ncbi:zinc-dependent alcohol dehydrogenase family protein [Acuticoccus sp. M5D2P5]|uniref:zinc-dependent alcohol dehydrogenase family protein n=1 Tax=Acuticoccus kalidii TaxID=2910977 RepID=UPI001F3258C1|nr:zinc-dependent alcohol dehydrogenase family protein [Acuticoccus kalidii]MCF3934152.1 zinc-dependent alcohol dehydrogenase family protein [Acuticoccus kalidii]
MRAMVLREAGRPLEEEMRPIPSAGPGELLIEVTACGVCRTDLHVVDGDLTDASYPVVPGHEVVGRVLDLGAGVVGWTRGDRVGVPWLGSTCGHCPYCVSLRENLCDAPTFTGYTRDGGFATHLTADARFCLKLPHASFDDRTGAPLLCAGLIGYRSYRMAGKAKTLGLYGFGAAAHIIAQVAAAEGQTVYAFTRRGDTRSQDFARSLGVAWAGASDEAPPEELDAAIIFAPVGLLVPEALKRVRKGGRVVCAGIHMSDIPGFPYADLWGEREVRSVANLTREDGESFMLLMERHPVSVHTTVYRLSEANTALADLRAGRLDGAAVLVP